MINRGVIRGFNRGIVTAASVCVNGRAFDEAVSLCKQNPQLDTGLHVTLIEEKAILRKARIRSLVDEENIFYKNTLTFLRMYFLGIISMGDIEAEIRAQIEKALASGLMISHIDSHRHLHLLPGINNCLLRLAKEYGIVYVRSGCFKPESMLSPGIAKSCLLNIPVLFLKRKLKRSGVFYCDRVMGLECSGHLTKERLLNLLYSLPDGVTELICHPGSGVQSLDNQYRNWGYGFENELDALLDLEPKELIKRRGIILTNYLYLSHDFKNGY